MSYSDDTAAFMFSGIDLDKYRDHKHAHTFHKATAEGWLFTCDCGHSILRSDAWMEAEGQRQQEDNMTG